MSDEKKGADAPDSDGLAILARRKKLLASAALSLAVSCEVRQEPQAPTQPSTPPTLTLPQSEPEPPLTAPTSAQSAPASTPSTPPIAKPPCLSRPPSICLKVKPPGKKCLSKIKPRLCLSEF